MSEINEIEISNHIPHATHPNLARYNGHNERKKSPSPNKKHTSNLTPSPQTYNFTKKANGDQFEIKSSSNGDSNGKTRSTSPQRVKTKSLILEDVKSLKADADALYNKGQYGDAIVKYKQALNYLHYDPKAETVTTVVNKSIYTKIISNIGQCLSKLDRADEAIVYFSQSIKLEPSNLKAYYRLAQLHNKKNDYDKGYETLKRGLPYVADMGDEQMRKLFTNYYHYTIIAQSNQLDGLKSRMRNFYSSGVAQKSEYKKGIAKSMSICMATSLTVSSVMTGCMMHAKEYNTNVLLLGLPANLLLWYALVKCEDKKKKILAAAGLIGVNVAIWKLL